MVELISVLYVDDEASLLLVGKIFLEESGDFFVTTVESAQEGLSFLEKEHVDAIVADYMMPYMDGIAFLKRVREQFGDIPFILFTGRGREEVVIEAINNGADFYLQKGGDPQAQFAELAHKIRQAVRRKEAEKLFCESEKRLSDIINFLPDATFAIDKSGKVIAWNRAIEEMTGVYSVEILGKGDHEYAIPFYGYRRPLCIDLILEQGENKSPYYSTVTRIGSTITAEVDINPKKGSLRRTLIKACPLYDEAGEIIGAIESIRDITDLKTAQQELMDSEKKFRNVVTYSRDCLLIVGFDGIIQFINQTGLSMIDEEDFDTVIGRKSIMEYIHPDSIRTVTSDMHTIEQGMDGYLSSYKLVTAKKREIWVESLGRKIPYQDSQMILTSLRDITEQKLADDELREREEKYRSIAQILPQMIFEVDPNMNITYLNEFGRALIGITLQDISDGISALSCIHPSSHQIIRDNFQMLLNGIPYEPVIYLAMRKDGSTFPIRIYPSIFYHNGKVAGIRGIVIDLSAQKKMERELQESEEKFRTLVEQSLDGIIIADFTGKTLFANPRVGDILSFKEGADLVGTTDLFSFVLPAGSQVFVNGLRRVESGADDFHEVFEVVTRDKRMIWIEITGKKIRYRGVPAVFLSIHEITEQKKALDALFLSEQNMAAIFKHSPIALTLVSAVDGVFIDVNEAFISSTGYSRDEVVGSTSETLGLFPDVEIYHQIVRVLRDHRQVSGMEIPVRSSSGEIRICQFSSSSLMIGGKPILLSSIQDITERKTTQAAFETLVRSMVGTTGIQSFQKIIESISSWLCADIAMVGELQPDQKTVKVLFMQSFGQEIRSLVCPFKGTPYADVLEKGFFICEDNVADLFPLNSDIQKNKIRGFIGASLKNSQDQSIGILCMFFLDPIKPSPAIRDIIDIVAVKAAAEIERERIEQVLKESQSKLAEAMDLAKIVNWEYDVDSGMFSFDDRFYALYGTTALKEGGTLMPVEVYTREFLYPGDSDLVAIETKKHWRQLILITSLTWSIGLSAGMGR